MGWMDGWMVVCHIWGGGWGCFRCESKGVDWGGKSGRRAHVGGTHFWLAGGMMTSTVALLAVTIMFFTTSLPCGDWVWFVYGLDPLTDRRVVWGLGRVCWLVSARVRR